MPDNIEPLSLDSAVSLLREPTTPEDNNENTAPAGAENEATQAAPVETPTQDTPADQGETEDGQADPGDALPTIEPPSSWKGEEKAGWESLPRNVQEAIARREQDQTKELRNLQNSTAEQRKAAEAEVTRLKTLADRIDTQVNTEVAELAREFPEIRNEGDVEALAQRDPARFALFQAKLMKFNAAQQMRADATKEIAVKEQAAQQEYLVKAKDALLEAFPTWKEPEVARREIVELQDYAIKLGATEQSARSNLDPVLFRLAQKAMLYDKAQTAKASALKNEPPRVVKPGAQSSAPRADSKAAARQAQLSKLDKSGDLEDAFGLLRL